MLQVLVRDCIRVNESYFKEICYIININGYLYSVYFTVTDIRYSDYNKQIFDKIWQSMKFE